MLFDKKRVTDNTYTSGRGLPVVGHYRLYRTLSVTIEYIWNTSFYLFTRGRAVGWQSSWILLTIWESRVSTSRFRITKLIQRYELHWKPYITKQNHGVSHNLWNYSFLNFVWKLRFHHITLFPTMLFNARGPYTTTLFLLKMPCLNFRTFGNMPY